MPIKFLDLDAVNKPIGRFKIHGQEYDIYPLKIKGLINLSAMSEVPADKQQSGAYIGRALEILKELVPECPQAELEDLNVDQVNAMVEFVNGLGVETVEKNSTPPARTKRLTSQRL